MTCSLFVIVDWTIRKKLQWTIYLNSYIFIHENAFENVFWEMSAIMSRPECVNDKVALHWIMAWRLIGDKPYLPEPVTA